MELSRSAPALLTTPDYYGTLAAARCLGCRGISVVMAGDRWLAPALWSRHVARRVVAPPALPHEPFVDWLRTYGRRHPGAVLYPTSDDLAWLVARHVGDLEPYFRLYAPSAATILRLLDKKQLYDACEDVGVATPRSWILRDTRDIASASRDASFPILLKPRTQALLASREKARVVTGPDDLRDACEAFRAANPVHPSLRAEVPDLDAPIAQELCFDDGAGIYSLSGFVARDGGVVMRAARKVLQWPRQVGVGICFEDAPVDADLSERVRALCNQVSYFGVFEAEFVVSSEQRLLIDFNPRFFGQLGFDVARGLPSPYLAYLGATGQATALATELERAGAIEPPRIYSNRFTVAWSTLLGRVARGSRAGEARRWLEWHRKSDVDHVDAASDRDDPLPGIADAATQLKNLVRHPRAHWRAAKR